MRLAPPRHLHRLREPTYVADVHAREVRDPPLYIWKKLPLARELLSDRERDPRHQTQRLIRLRRLIPNRLLQEVQRRVRETLAEARRFGHAQPVMEVDPQRELAPQRLPNVDQPLGRLLQ